MPLRRYERLCQGVCPFPKRVCFDQSWFSVTSPCDAFFKVNPTCNDPTTNISCVTTHTRDHIVSIDARQRRRGDVDVYLLVGFPKRPGM